jgi:protein TonB
MLKRWLQVAMVSSLLLAGCVQPTPTPTPTTAPPATAGSSFNGYPPIPTETPLPANYPSPTVPLTPAPTQAAGSYPALPVTPPTSPYPAPTSGAVLNHVGR